MSPPEKALRNRTLTCSPEEEERLARSLIWPGEATVFGPETVRDALICGDSLLLASRLPRGVADLLILDPPYNLSRDYHGTPFRRKKAAAYAEWFGGMLDAFAPVLKAEGSLYVCADWETSLLIGPLLMERFTVRNRITWEREKGRGAQRNWKNNTEDLWFCTLSDDYFFDVEAVKLRRRVIAPYRDEAGRPKDWTEEADGNFRLTHPSNVWTDLTIPFWSMPENTDHPTQKPEKLLARLILASSRPGELVFDPFLGSGTTAVVARKLGRQFLGIEQNRRYACWAAKRLERAAEHPAIQGFSGGVFHERNSGASG